METGLWSHRGGGPPAPGRTGAGPAPCRPCPSGRAVGRPWAPVLGSSAPTASESLSSSSSAGKSFSAHKGPHHTRRPAEPTTMTSCTKAPGMLKLRVTAAHAPAHEHLEETEVIAGDVPDATDGRILPHKGLEQPCGPSRLSGRSGGSAGPQCRCPWCAGPRAHELITDPAIVGAEQVARVDAGGHKSSRRPRKLGDQLLHAHKGGQEAQHIPYKAHQLRVVA